MTLDRRIAALERALPDDIPAIVCLCSPVHEVTLAGVRYVRTDAESEAEFVQRVERGANCRGRLIVMSPVEWAL